MKIIFLVGVFIIGLLLLSYRSSRIRKHRQEHPETVKDKPKPEIKDEKISPEEDPLSLVSESVILKPHEDKDNKGLSLVYSNKAVADALGRERIKSYSEMDDVLKDYRDQIGIYTILLKSSGRVIGLASLTPEDKINIVIGKQFWGHGFGQNTAAVLIDEAERNGVDTLYTRILPGNKRGTDFAQKLGFKKQKDDIYSLDLSARSALESS